ncbi:FG-GAP-like repeat-containing protein [Chitinophaga lutea]
MSLSCLKTAFKGFLSLLTVYILSLSPAAAQMRQMYQDTDPDSRIHKVSFFSPSEGYVAFNNWVGYTTDSGRTYIKKYVTLSNVNYGSYTNINLTFGFGIEGVKAFDKNTLIVYGDYGLVPAILYSTDGGNSFKLVYHSQYNPMQLSTGIKDIDFLQNSNIGYAVDADRILKTTNKGLTWDVQAIRPGYFFDHIDAVDDNYAFATASGNNTGSVLKTTNGGASWSNMTLPQTGTPTYAYFLTGNIGWLSMYDSRYKYFYKTTNGGQQWTLLNDVDATPFNCDKMWFSDVNTGYALVAPYQVYKTTNSGVTWEPLSREIDFTYLGYSHNDLQCLSATQLWAGGDYGLLEMTSNGGAPMPAAYFKTDTTGMYMAGTVQLVNFSKAGYQYQWLVNGSLISTSYNAAYTHEIVRSADTVQLIVTAGGISDTLTKYPQFYGGGIAKANSYYPKSGSTGTFVTITGSRFTNVSGVSFGGIAAASFTVLSDTVITAVVAGGATGNLTLKQFYGTVPVGTFTYNPPPTAQPPVIQAVSPAAGIVGTTVTITGNGFGNTPSQNSVYFGTVPAKLQSASSGQLVCTVPVGASLGTIQVLNKDNGLLGESPSPFHVPFADSAVNFTPNSFTEGLIVNKGTGIPSELQGKDIDGDGKPDIILNIYTYPGDSIVVIRNTTIGGRLSFAPKVNVGNNYSGARGLFAINDLDGDGRPDLVLSTNRDLVKAFRNTSNPGIVSFEKEYLLPAGRGTQEAVITDLDNDGKNDIAVNSFSEYRVCVMRNTSVPGSLSFGATQNFNTPNMEPLVGLAAGDLDGDGLKDVVAYPSTQSNTSEGSIFLFRNTSTRGNISLAPFVRISVPGISFSASFISIVDFDLDGKTDIVICNDQAICVLRSNSTMGNISFLPPVVMRLHFGNYVSGSGGSVSNFSGTIRPDVVWAHFGVTREIRLEKNSSLPGTPKLDSLIYGPGGNSTRIFTRSVAAADFDGDGKTDLAASTPHDDKIVIVYKNTVNAPVITPMCTSSPGEKKLASDLSGKTYQWQQDTGAGFTNVVNNTIVSGATTSALYFSNMPVSWNGYKYRCMVDGRYSSIFELQLNYTPSPGIITTASDTTFCLGTNVTFTATDSSGYKSNYLWQWQVNGKNVGYYNSSLSINTLQDLDQVRVICIYYDICNIEHRDTSNAITVHVKGATAAVQISASNLAACIGTPVTFTASPTNPGNLPIYDWKVNNVSQGINNPVFTSSVLKKNDIVKVLMKSAATCAYPNPAQSNVLTMAVLDTGSLSVSITTATTTVCTGANVTFTAFPRNVGLESSYQWTVNGVAAGTNANTFNTSTLQDNDKVQCMLTSPSACRLQTQVNSGILTMSVKSNVVPSVSLSIRDTAICTGSTVVISAIAVNPGAAPVYQWKSNGVITGSNSPDYTINGLTNNTTVSVLLRSNAACANPNSSESTPVVITAKPIPTIRISGDTVVIAGAKSLYTATTTYSGTDLQYQWQDSTNLHSWQNINGAAGDNINYEPAASSNKIRCVCSTSAGCTATSNAIAIRNNVITATPDIAAVDAGYRWYPNPVSSTLCVQNEDRSDPVLTIVVLSNSGNRLLVVNNTGRQEMILIDVSALPGGAYFVETKRKSGKTRCFQILKLR